MRKEVFHTRNRPTSFGELPLVLTVEEREPVLSIGRNTAYNLVRSGRIKSIRAGNSAMGK